MLRGYRALGFIGVFLFFHLFSSQAIASKNVEDCANALTGPALSAAWIQQMHKAGQAANPQEERLRHVVQDTGFRAAVLNQEIIRNHTNSYTLELAQGPLTNQKQSGRCWIFAALNMLRSVLIERGVVDETFEFSENYIYFFSLLEKSNRHLEDVIKKRHRDKKESDLEGRVNPSISDGGYFSYFAFLVAKYGLVPKQAMRETKSSEGSKDLLESLNQELAAVSREILDAANDAADDGLPRSKRKMEMRRAKLQGMNRVWRILATHLGDPPAEFEWREQGKRVVSRGAVVHTPAVRKFTAMSFARDVVQFNPKDFVILTKNPDRETGKLYIIPRTSIGYSEIQSEKNKNPFDHNLLNLSSQRMEEIVIRSLQGLIPVPFSADIHPEVDKKTGIMHPDIFQSDAVYGFHREKENRTKLSMGEKRFFEITGPNHAMQIAGLDQPDPKSPIVKFKVENSWGKDQGTDGVFHMYREWFHKYGFRVVVHKKFLGPEELKALEAEPVILSNDEATF